MKSRDIIFTGIQSWDVYFGCNSKDIAIEMSKNNRVLYVNPTINISTLAKNKFRYTKPNRGVIREITPSLFVIDLPVTILSINFIKSEWLFDVLNKINNKIIAAAIKTAAAELGFRDVIHFNDNDIFNSFYLKDLLKPKLSIYYRRDWLFEVDYWKCHGISREPIIARKSDLVLANSPHLTATIKPYNEKSYYVGQGVDLSMYDPSVSYEMPPELAKIKRPIIGYIGALNVLRLDPDLIANVAEKMPDHSFVLVGPEDSEFKQHRLHSLDNVIFTGNRPLESLAAYVSHFDVCINPQHLNETTKCNYPRKIDEYLAMGKPTIATMTPTMAIFEKYTLLPSDVDGYVAAIHEAVETDNESLRNQRIEFAKGHSWPNSVNEIYKYIDPLL